ncbi:MAG: hypothetical protein PHW02_08030 [bacterium]|nr:hypothetical protein [bacterium]
MERIRNLEHKGKKIFFVDLKDSRVSAENIEIINSAKEMIMKMGEKSVLLLSDYTNAHYDIPAAEAMKEFSKNVTPYVKASAVLGVTGIKRILFNSVVKLTGRHIEIFDTMEDALNYLVEQ